MLFTRTNIIETKIFFFHSYKFEGFILQQHQKGTQPPTIYVEIKVSCAMCVTCVSKVYFMPRVFLYIHICGSGIALSKTIRWSFSSFANSVATGDAVEFYYIDFVYSRVENTFIWVPDMIVLLVSSAIYTYVFDIFVGPSCRISQVVNLLIWWNNKIIKNTPCICQRVPCGFLLTNLSVWRARIYLPDAWCRKSMYICFLRTVMLMCGTNRNDVMMMIVVVRWCGFYECVKIK